MGAGKGTNPNAYTAQGYQREIVDLVMLGQRPWDMEQFNWWDNNVQHAGHCTWQWRQTHQWVWQQQQWCLRRGQESPRSEVQHVSPTDWSPVCSNRAVSGTSWRTDTAGFNATYQCGTACISGQIPIWNWRLDWWAQSHWRWSEWVSSFLMAHQHIRVIGYSVKWSCCSCKIMKLKTTITTKKW